MVIRERVLKEFSSWDLDRQKSELEKYKLMDDFSPLTENDYELMDMIMDDPDKNKSIDCNGGVCEIVSEEEILEIDEILNEVYEMNASTNKTTIYILKKIYGYVKGLKKEKPEMHTLKLILNNIYRMSMTSNSVYAAASEKALGLIIDILRPRLDKKKPPLFFSKALSKSDGGNDKKIKNIFKTYLDDEEFGLVFKKISNTHINTFFKNITEIDPDNLDKDYKPLADIFRALDTSLKAKVKNIEVIRSKQLEGGDEDQKEIVVSTEFVDNFRDKVEKLTGRTDLDYDKSNFLFNYLEAHFDELDAEILKYYNSAVVSEETIKNFNSKTYSNEFFLKMFKHEEVRQFGKGEILVEFLFDGVKINGGSESYDLNTTKGSLLGKTQLEIKAYDTESNIAIGTTGKISRFPVFAEITRLLKYILVILKDDNLLNSLKKNAVKYSDVITDQFTIDALDELHSRMQRAEVPSKFFEYFDEIIPKIKSAFTVLSENKLDNMNTVRINDKYVTFEEMTDLEEGSVLKVVSVSDEDTDNVTLKEAIRKVLNHPFIDKDLHMLGSGGKLEEALTQINEKFEKTPMILLLKKGGFRVGGIYTKFEFATVTLGEIKISPVK